LQIITYDTSSMDIFSVDQAISDIQRELPVRDQKQLQPISMSEIQLAKSSAELDAAEVSAELASSLVTLITGRLRSINSPSLSALVLNINEAAQEHALLHKDAVNKYRDTLALKEASMLVKAQLAALLETYFRKLLNAYVNASRVNFDRAVARITPDSQLSKKLRNLADAVHSKFLSSAGALRSGIITEPLSAFFNGFDNNRNFSRAYCYDREEHCGYSGCVRQEVSRSVLSTGTQSRVTGTATASGRGLRGSRQYALP
jgi:hypothetical protein